MHSQDFPKHGIVIHYNGDYSGDAKINFYSLDGNGDEDREVEIPCEVLTAFGWNAAIDRVVEVVEGLQK